MSESKMVGMYRVLDPDYPSVKVGEYTICRHDAESIWIQTDGGEGAQFPDNLFEKTIRDMYEKNF